MLSKEQIIEALKLAEQVGVSFKAQARAPDGWGEYPLSAESLAACIVEKHNPAAFAVGLSDSEFDEWIQNNGGIRCNATTKARNRCRCFVPRVRYTDPRAWKHANEAGGYCDIHGG